MKKVGVLGILFVILLLGIVIADTNSSVSSEDKAYSCLEGKVKNKCSSLTFEEQVFSLLALSSKSDIQTECKTALKSKSSNNQCWPSSSCKIKDTAQAVLALGNINEDVSSAVSWIKSHNVTPTDLEWFLEVDSNEVTVCKVAYDGSDKALFTINSDKKLTSFSDSGNCLSLAYSNYWLQIGKNTRDCMKKKYTVSCDKGFTSTLLYKRSSNNCPSNVRCDVWHVTSDVKQGSPAGITEHEINSYCYSTSASCDYESNLWAALVLARQGNDIKPLLPYLITFSEENSKFFPDSFLFALTNSQENLQKIILSQKPLGYWEFDADKFYDTAIAFFGLSSNEDAAKIKAKTWLTGVQGTDGCWNNIRDTGFLLYSAFYRSPVVGPSEIPSCQDYSHYCMNLAQCNNVQGQILQNFVCIGQGTKICCDKPLVEETCDEKGGQVCGSGTVCSVTVVDSADESNCCIGTCEEIVQENTCEEISGNFCRISCTSSETESTSTSLTCPTIGDVCCVSKPSTKKSLWWLWVLIILIILVVLAIIFRNRLRMLLFSFQSRFKKDEVTKTRPPFPPMPPSSVQRPMPRPIFQQRSAYPTPQRPAAKADNELEDTLKKLREMSK